MSRKKEVFAIYFPSWNPDRHYGQWYGKGFSEWELVKTTKPLFDGHEQPKVPEWGYFDESDPVWMEKQIDLAADHRQHAADASAVALLAIHHNGGTAHAQGCDAIHMACQNTQVTGGGADDQLFCLAVKRQTVGCDDL